MKTIVEREISVPGLDPEVTAYIRAIFRKQLLSEGIAPADVERRVPKEADISAILRDEWTDVCGRLEGHEGPANRLDCLTIVERVRRLASDEMRVRKLGRLLQAEASGYELPISDLPGRSAQVAADLRGILNIWGAGGGAVATSQSGTMVRVTSLAPRIKANPALYRQLLGDVGSALTTLDGEERVAAVWRYQYGVRLVRNERAPRFPAPHTYTLSDSGPGTERQFLFHRWDDDPDLEGKLLAVWQEMLAAAADPRFFTPPLRSGETALLVFPEELQNLLPGNILLWARIDADSIHPMGDVGLQWHVPLEPVLPSLTHGEQPILGGTYPPAPVKNAMSGSTAPSLPVDGDGLCTSPAGMRGYLCRPIDPPDATERCPAPADLPPHTISLVWCKDEQSGAPEGEWCCMRDENRCRYAASAVSCTQAGGSPSGSPAGCVANGCPEPPVNPMWCCVPGEGAQCKRTINSTECSLQGGSPSVDATGCRANGCVMPADESRFTAAGADVCREIPYLHPEASSSDAVQHTCQLNIQCAPGCSVPANNSAITYGKGADGTVNICLMEQSPDINNTYLLYHELVHAQYYCGLPPGTTVYREIPAGASSEVAAAIRESNDVLCCEHEGTAYRAQCDLMERDGVFAAAGGSMDGIPLNAETCAEVWTDSTCRQREGGKGCYLSRAYPEAFVQKMFHLADNPAQVPATCSSLVTRVDGKTTITDPRAAGFAEAIDAGTAVCDPESVSRYDSRIGSHLCFIGQCVEQSLERHRVLPGRTPSVVADSVAPWDDPFTGTPLGALLMQPPLTLTRFPSYRPELLLRTMETALCQAQGMPPRTPPILCALSAQRRLSFEQGIGWEAAWGLLQQTKEQQETDTDLLSLSPALGARAGTALYARYLEESSRSFALLLRTAADLLADMTTISFPTQMCPISPGLPAPVRP